MMIEQFQTFLFDLDGVIYIKEEALPGAPEALERLRKQGKAIRFLTNDPVPTREEVAGRLQRLGIEARIEEIVTSGWATAAFLRREAIQTAYAVGSDGLRAELVRAGIRPAGSGDRCEAVVVGCAPQVGYPDIQRATQLIHRGARFVATNADATFPTPDGPAPATGAIVAAVRTASGQAPVIVGKPFPAMFKIALRGLDHRRAVMIGDNPATDIVGARRFGIAAILVSSRRPPTRTEQADQVPDLTVPHLLALFTGKEAANENGDRAPGD